MAQAPNKKMQMSESGRKALDREEAVVLKAYRDVTGTLTIGAGLTKASGVVDPKPGMIITRKEADRLTALALERNYEPAVRKAMPDAAQCEFDGGCSFHWNTGAIGRASWVKAWLKLDWPGVLSGLLAWNKSKGRVLPGLTARRQREFNMIRFGHYGFAVDTTASSPDLAVFVIPMESDDREAVRVALIALGYSAGTEKTKIRKQAVYDFQQDHDLTRDGKIGKATLSTIQRRIDAKKKSVAAIAAPATATAATGVDAVSNAYTDAFGAWVAPASIGLALLLTLWTAWSYRDVIAAKVSRRFPRLAAKLRSI